MAKLRVLATTSSPAIECPATRLGSVWAVLCTGSTPDSAPNGGRLGVGPRVPAIEAAQSWQAACSALRFATTREPVVYWDQLGCLGVLADRLDPTDIAQLADLTALDQLAAEPCGGDMLALLDAVCVTNSARQAATILHRHHSTIPPRLAHAQKVLQFPLNTPAGRFRLHLALILRRLRDNPSDQRTAPNPA